MGFTCNTIIQYYSTHVIRHENHNSTTAHQFSCCVQTEAVAYKSALTRPSARNSRYGTGGVRCGGCVSHRQELSTSPSHCCSCEREYDPALLLIESRHDALDSPSTLCIRVPSPLAWGRNNVRELRALRRHVLGGGGCLLILTASLFFVRQCYRGYLL